MSIYPSLPLTPPISNRKTAAAVPNLVSPDNDISLSTKNDNTTTATTIATKMNQHNKILRRSQSPTPGPLGRGDLTFASLSRCFSKEDYDSTTHFTNQVMPESPVPRRPIQKNSTTAAHPSSNFSVSMDHDGAFRILAKKKEDDPTGKILPSTPQPSSRNIDELVNKLSHMRRANEIIHNTKTNNSPPPVTSMLFDTSSFADVDDKIKQQPFHMISPTSFDDNESNDDRKTTPLRHTSSSKTKNNDDESAKTTTTKKPRSHSASRHISHYDMTIQSVSSQDSNMDVVLNDMFLNTPRPSPPSRLVVPDGFPENNHPPSLTNHNNNISQVSSQKEDYEQPPRGNCETNYPHTHLNDWKNAEISETNESSVVDMVKTNTFPKRKVLMKYIGCRHELYGSIVEVVDDSLDSGIIRIMSPSRGRPFFVKKSDVEVLVGET